MKKGAKTKNKYANARNSRLGEQRRVMDDIISRGHCPFCSENLLKYHKQPIIKNGKFWILTKNQWPYKNTKLHLLAIYKKHAVKLSEINPEAGKELLSMFKWVEKKYKVPGGGFAMRFGDTSHSAGTVNHIHAQFILPDIKNPKYEPVRFKIGE